MTAANSIVAAATPRAVLCLLSALVFHGVGTQNPFEAWVAVDRRDRAPKLPWPPLRVMRFSGRARTRGIEEHLIEGQRVRVYSLPKTIADCFKYRNKVGLDVALEALKESLRYGRVRPVDLDGPSRDCRVERVMAPYVEALVA